jgi:hypothetical protein
VDTPLDTYWKAVAKTFPEAWQDKRNYILLQTIGLGGFAIYGATIIDEAYEHELASLDDFIELLRPIAGVSLHREEYRGIAGAGGAREVAHRLIAAADPEQAKAQRVARKWGGEPATSERIARAEQDLGLT